MTAENGPFFLKITVDDSIALKCPNCFTITMNDNDNREGSNCNHVLMDKKIFMEIPSSASSVNDILEELKRNCHVRGPLHTYIDGHLVLEPLTRVNISSLQDKNIKICSNPYCGVLEDVPADIDANADANVGTDANANADANVDTDPDHGNEGPNLNLTAMSFPREPLLSSTPRHGDDGNEYENGYGGGDPHDTESFTEFTESVIDDEVGNEDESNVEDSSNSQESAILLKTLSVIPEAETEVEEHHNDEVLDPEDVEVTLMVPQNELQISEFSEQESVNLESLDVGLEFDRISTYPAISEEALKENCVVYNQINEEAGSSASTSALTLTTNSESKSSIKLGPGQSHRQTNENVDFVTGRNQKFSSIASDGINTTRSFSLTPLSSSSSGASDCLKTMKMNSENVSSQVGNMTGKRVIAVDQRIWRGKISDEYREEDTSQWSLTSETSVSSTPPSGSPVNISGTPTPKVGILLKSSLPYRGFVEIKIESENQGKLWYPISSLSEEEVSEGSYLRFKFVVKEKSGGEGAENFDIVLFVKELGEDGVTGFVIHENDAMVKYENERFFSKYSIQNVLIWK